MIHSMSGGVLSSNMPERYAKVEIGGAPCWFIAPFALEAGDRVLAPMGEGTAEGVVLRCELCTPQTAPVSPKRAKRLLKKLS